jgi:hypothetical protein
MLPIEAGAICVYITVATLTYAHALLSHGPHNKLPYFVVPTGPSAL